MTRDEVIDKIRKLLRMKRGGTASEAETALGLAAELARKHGIDLEGVNPDEESDRKIGHEDLLALTRIQFECKYAALVCQQFFKVQVLGRRVCVQVFGGTFPPGMDQAQRALP